MHDAGFICASADTGPVSKKFFALLRISWKLKIDRGETNMRLFLASMCAIASLFISGCGPVPGPPSSSSPTIYVFSAEWCLACQQDKPRLKQFEEDGYCVKYIDIDKYPKLRYKYNVTLVPCYIVICDGQMMLRTHDLNQAIQAVRNGCSVQKQEAVSKLS